MKKIFGILLTFSVLVNISIAPVLAIEEIVKSCTSGSPGINTAIGCIPFGNSNELATFVLRWGVGIGGGIAFLLLLIAGFMIMTSTGNPERLKAGRELLTSAITGLLMLIFSVFILRLIGVDILGIPEFGK